MSVSSGELEKWLNPKQTSIEELYVLAAMQSPQADAFGGDLAKRGRDMFLSIHGQLQLAICNSPKIQAHPFLSDEMADKIALAAIIVTLIPAKYAEGINAMLIAAIVIRIGIRRFCEGFIRDNSE